MQNFFMLIKLCGLYVLLDADMLMNKQLLYVQSISFLVCFLLEMLAASCLSLFLSSLSCICTLFFLSNLSSSLSPRIKTTHEILTLTEKAIFILHINLYNKLVLYQLFHTSHKMLGRTSIVKYDTNIVCISR